MTSRILRSHPHHKPETRYNDNDTSPPLSEEIRQAHKTAEADQPSPSQMHRPLLGKRRPSRFMPRGTPPNPAGQIQRRTRTPTPPPASPGPGQDGNAGSVPLPRASDCPLPASATTLNRTQNLAATTATGSAPGFGPNADESPKETLHPVRKYNKTPIFIPLPDTPSYAPTPLSSLSFEPSYALSKDSALADFFRGDAELTPLVDIDDCPFPAMDPAYCHLLPTSVNEHDHTVDDSGGQDDGVSAGGPGGEEYFRGWELSDSLFLEQGYMVAPPTLGRGEWAWTEGLNGQSVKRWGCLTI